MIKVIFVGFVLANLMMIMGHPTSSYPNEEANPAHPEQSSPPETRGIFYDLYKDKIIPTVVVQVPGGSPPPPEDVGESISLGVVKATVTLADSGLQIAQDILKTVQSEILEAFRPEYQTVPHA